MTVLENVALGAHLRRSAGVVAAALRIDRGAEAQLLHEAATQLQRVGLGDYLYEQAGNLALGQQRILEIARSDEHTTEIQSIMCLKYDVAFFTKNKQYNTQT